MVKQFSTLVVGAIAFGLASSSPADAQLKKISVLQPIPVIDIRNAPWAVALEKGWFAESGLDVDIKFTKGSVVVVQQLLNGSAQYGMPAPEPAVIANGKGGTLKFIYASTTKNPFPLAVLDAGPIKHLKDLKGTVIGLHDLVGVQYYSTQSILHSVGFKMNVDYEYVEVGAGPAALKALTDNRVAALSINIFTYGGFENRGAKLRYLSTPDVETILGWGLATTGPYLEANRDEAIKLARGFHRGHLFCRASPIECVDLFLKRFPTVRTPGIPDDQVAKDQLRLLGKFNEYAPQTPGQPWGWVDEKSWKAVIDFMVASRQLPAPIEASSMYTNSLINAVNQSQ